ncbi:hypothetical protein KM043_018505 [Ampulex compressa]|nr:hypothetical protein KM043_018505 [Ampulex compressa]
MIFRKRSCLIRVPTVKDRPAEKSHQEENRGYGDRAHVRIPFTVDNVTNTPAWTVSTGRETTHKDEHTCTGERDEAISGEAPAPIPTAFVHEFLPKLVPSRDSGNPSLELPPLDRRSKRTEGSRLETLCVFVEGRSSIEGNIEEAGRRARSGGRGSARNCRRRRHLPEGALASQIGGSVTKGENRALARVKQGCRSGPELEEDTEPDYQRAGDRDETRCCAGRRGQA